MRAGELREVITIQQQGTTTDEMGGNSQSNWTTFTTSYAKVTPVSGYEKFNYNQVYEKVEYKIALRHINGLTTKMRVLWRSKQYDITYIQNENGRYRELILYCSEVM